MAQQPKVALIGAGSLFFGRKAIWQMVHSPHLQAGTLALVDTDAKRLDKMRRLAEMVVAHNKSPLKIEASTERREVLADSDFVILSFADRNAHFRGVDVNISAKYGIRMCSGDTIGPGGVMRTLREWPQIDATCRDILELCPNAWVINYINPSAVHGIGLKRFHPEIKLLALCDAQWGLRGHYAKCAGVADDDKLVIQSAGPNHFTWLLRAEYDERDITEAIVDAMRQHAEEDANKQAQGGAADAKGLLNNAIAVELYDRFGALPTVVAHTKEYVRFFQHPGVEGRDPIPPLKLFEADKRMKWTDDVWARVDAYLDGSAAISEFDTEFGPDPATDLVENMWANLGKPMFINTFNNGAVSNMSDDAFLETLCDVGMDGARPRPVGPMPRGIRGMCETVLDTHELTAEAAYRTDRTLLIRAMLTDPLTSSIGDTEALVDELLSAERDAVSEDWFNA